LALTPEDREQLVDRVLRSREKQEQNSPFPAANLNDAEWNLMRQVIEGLVIAQRPLRAAAQKVVQEYGLAQQGPFILSLIQGGIVYPLELSTTLRVSRSLITKEIAKLNDAGLVESVQDNGDKRRTRLALTENGMRVCEDVRRTIIVDIKQKLAGFSELQIVQFVQMLQALNGSLAGLS
jgi:DNA-binding MarR family transcriptional regulator